MRADKRSFSFTWMRGQKDSSSNAQSDTGIVNPQTMDFEMGHPNDTVSSSSTWYMTNTSTASSSSGVSSMSGSSSITSIGGVGVVETEQNKDLKNENSDLTRSDSKNRLKRLGHSFTRFGTKYSIIEDDEENEPLNSVAPTTPAPETPSVQNANEKSQNPEPVHFDEDGNFIGRQGRSAQKRKSHTSAINKDMGFSTTTASLGKRLNKTVQEVKASLGNFSQKFRRSTRRRYRMGRGTPLAELTPTRKILGRTPTKLYSPFEIGFDSPAATKTPKRLERPSTPRRARRSVASGSGLLYSPANNFRNDLADARRGMEDFHILSRDITRRSVRF